MDQWRHRRAISTKSQRSRGNSRIHCMVNICVWVPGTGSDGVTGSEYPFGDMPEISQRLRLYYRSTTINMMS
jgi:hypothetical protein